MGSSGSESFTSGYVDHELISRSPEEDMVVRLALHRSREAASLRQRGDSQRRESIASAKPVPGSGIAASPEAVRSVWRSNAVVDAQALHWRAEYAPWASSNANMTRHARRARQRALEASKALTAVDVGEVESNSPVSGIMHECGRSNHVVVNIVSSQKGSVIDLTSTDTVRVTCSDEEGMKTTGARLVRAS
ncbi:ATP-dependent DNA helicase Q4 [Hordeum vulgare]|nr:ATP-dependent DNA helicase Q4 [Hordeum vulgare]